MLDKNEKEMTFDYMFQYLPVDTQVEMGGRTYRVGAVEKMCAGCADTTRTIAIDVGCYTCKPSCAAAIENLFAAKRGEVVIA